MSRRDKERRGDRMTVEPTQQAGSATGDNFQLPSDRAEFEKLMEEMIERNMGLLTREGGPLGNFLQGMIKKAMEEVKGGIGDVGLQRQLSEDDLAKQRMERGGFNSVEEMREQDAMVGMK
jgi:hypothetical protein